MVADFVGTMNFVSGSVAGGIVKIGDVSVPELVRLMANRDLTEHFPKTHVERGAELLRVERVTVAGKLSDISFSLHAGEVVGKAGISGNGQGELLAAVLDQERCTGEHGRRGSGIDRAADGRRAR